jgi:hypothetical protein
MSVDQERRNKAFVLEAFDTLFNKRDYACGSPEIVEGFLCRFRLGRGFPDLVVDGR